MFVGFLNPSTQPSHPETVLDAAWPGRPADFACFWQPFLTQICWGKNALGREKWIEMAQILGISRNSESRKVSL